MKELSLKLNQISVKQNSFLCLIQLIHKSHLLQWNKKYNSLFEGDPKTTIQIFERYHLKIIEQIQVYFLKINFNSLILVMLFNLI